MAKADLSAAYAIGDYVERPEQYPEKWADAALSFRETEHAIGRARLNLPYGSHERQALDLFLPSGKPEGLLVFVHGGYWKAFDRKSWSHLAQGAALRGWATAVPGYRLAPEVRITDITLDVIAAVTKAADLVAGPIVVSGHSAGGHLTANLNVKQHGLGPEIADRIRLLVPISPVADLRPLLQTTLGVELRLDEGEAKAQSPVLATDRFNLPSQIWVGAEERASFLDQARGLENAWPEAVQYMAPGQNHFDILDQLTDPDSPMMARILPA